MQNQSSKQKVSKAIKITTKAQKINAIKSRIKQTTTIKIAQQKEKQHAQWQLHFLINYIGNIVNKQTTRTEKRDVPFAYQH